MDINTNLSSTSVNPLGPGVRSQAEVETDNTRQQEIGQSSQARPAGEDAVELSTEATELAGALQQAEGTDQASPDDEEAIVSADSLARTGEPEQAAPDPSSIGPSSDGPPGSNLDVLV